MAFVLDTSITVSWGLEDEENARADLALKRLDTETAHVPALWWFEVRNVLLINERRRRITERDSAMFLLALSAMSIEIDRFPADEATMALARRHALMVYDSSYLELALRENMPLATLDTKLAAAARGEGVQLIG